MPRGGGVLSSIGSAAGSAGISWKNLIPTGFPASTNDLKSLIKNTVTTIPAIQTVSGAVSTISDVATSITSVSDTITNLPNVVNESVKGVVEATLAKAGIPAIGSSGASGSGTGSANGASGSEASGSEASGSNNAEQEGGASGSGPNDSMPVNTVDIEQFGGNRYELVTLSRPISDPLFVYYKSGKPVYFTRGSKGVQILSKGHMTMSVKKKKRATRRRHRRYASKL
jgi:hypothetical protein